MPNSKAFAMDDQPYYDLSTQDGLMAFVGTFPPQLIVDFVSQNINGNLLQDLAAFGHQAQSQAAASSVASDNDEIIPDEVVETVASETKPLRPLNAFMGFRSWYSKILPDAQQKDISSFITKLWAQDVYRNEWILIAKLYSSVRDTVGKKNITLKSFLSHACPIMQIVAPEHYLKTFNWTVSINELGDRTLQQDSTAAKNAAPISNQGSPTTEMELLQAILNDGFMPKYAPMLLERLAGNANGLMTTSRGNRMQEFVQALMDDPTGTAAQVLGSATPVITNTAEVEDLSALNDSYILDENELSHYPVNMAQELQSQHAFNIDRSVGAQFEYLENTSINTASFGAGNQIVFENQPLARTFEQSGFHQVAPSSMNGVPHPNGFSADFIHHGALLNFPLSRDHQEEPVSPDDQYQHSVGNNNNFRYF